MTRAACLALAVSAYLVLYLLTPFYDPNTLPPGLRLLFLLNGGVLLVGVYGFLHSFARPTSQEESHG